MKARHALAVWKGVRMRKAQLGADPDAPIRSVTVPADWNDAAASALLQLAPGEGPVSLAQASARWIDPLAAAAADDGDLVCCCTARRRRTRRSGEGSGETCPVSWSISRRLPKPAPGSM